MSEAAFSELLNTLNVPRGGVLYVQSSTDWLSKAGFNASHVLNGLLDWVGTSGTLVMPTYPCRTTHTEYLQSSPTYDVRKTPAGIGLIPEVFRRRPGAIRSLDPDFSIAADGPASAQLTATTLGIDPFGADSTYERIIRVGGSLLGLGVSLNTNSFIHVIDSRLQDRYPRHPYGELYDAVVIDHHQARRTVRRRALKPEFQQQTKPSEVARRVGDRTDLLTTASIGSVQFFRWDLPKWSAWCQAHAETAVANGQMPCWLPTL